jgi:SAM-dependent methyltransferase
MSQTHLIDRQEAEYEFPYHYIAQYKNGFAETICDTWGLSYASSIEYILCILKSEQFFSLVDIGCGDGRLTREIAREFPGRRVVGIDYSEKAIRLAMAMHPEGEFHICDLSVEDTIREKFDIAAIIEVLEHIDPHSLDRFLKGVSGMMRKNGILILTVPHVNVPVGYKHFQHFSSESISKWIEPYFDVVDIIPIEKMGYRRYLLERALVNPFFILNYKPLKNLIYTYFKKMLFFAEGHKCGRIFIRAINK